MAGDTGRGAPTKPQGFHHALTYCHSFPPLPCDIISICSEDCLIKKSPQPSGKGAKSLLLFPAQVLSLSRCVTKIRELAVNAQSHDGIYAIVNKAVNRFLGQERERVAGGKMKDSLAMLLKKMVEKCPFLPLSRC